jgi:hypothetical protein
MQQVISDLETLGVVTNRDQQNYCLSKQARIGIPDVVSPPPEKNITVNLTCSTLSTDDTDEHNSSLRGGRPSGTTIVDQMKHCKRKVDCINDIAKTFADKKLNTTTTITKNYLKDLITQKWID